MIASGHNKESYKTKSGLFMAFNSMWKVVVGRRESVLHKFFILHNFLLFFTFLLRLTSFSSSLFYTF